MSVPSNIFREYDIRGLVESELTPPVMEVLGRAAARRFRREGQERVVVGRDNRLSSDSLRDALVRGLVSEGMRVADLGVVTTPLFYFARVHYGFDAGLMITASHNPPTYNGLKVALGFATLYGEQIQELGRMARQAAAEEPPLGAVVSGEGRVEHLDPSGEYLRILQEKLRLARPLKVAVDCGNGTASLFAVDFLTRLGCEVVPLYCESDGRFPHHQPDPVERENLHDLSEVVRAERCDVGLGFDGDGDRLGVVDDQGEVMWGDEMMILYWREILPGHPGATAIIEVKCSQALVEEVERLGGRPLFYKTGHSLIKAKMRELGAVFTGEMSGHMFFADEYYGFDDAFYAAGRFLRILAADPRPLSEIRRTVPRYPGTAETRVPCTSDEAKFRVVQALRERFEKEYRVIDVDGARVLFPDGWGLARASNTQPVIVARCEGRTEGALARIERVMKEALTAFPEVGDFQWAH
ncbi:phosphomannomutase/phosphoglucomutase [Limnochorda pilosa]|uniref:phosphomannomutase/phosphoglucomutase n=1 Tax=Limnochorda pilosa TaxID=1555112 RepID=UPI00083157E1